MEEFSPKTNIIVGRNGSGKSNFFAAIRFVLSDAYTQMGREERQALLHEGSGSAVMSAYVEIIFDNSDERFPTGKDELILRRTIGLKKDEYSLDRKNATKADVMNLLESAGFSRSNPYYIVPQGRVTTLTNMKDAERLNLLKEFAVTQVYEARRTESLKIMTDTNNKRQKIDELLEYIKERLAELEEEKEELRKYQDKDKERRCLEYTYHHREQVNIADQLDMIDESREEGIGRADENRDAFSEGERAIAELDAEMSELHRQMELLKIERRQLEEDRREALKVRAKIELDLKTLTDGQSASEQAKARHDRELKAVKRDIAQKEQELSTLLPEYIARKENEHATKLRLDAAEAARQRIFAKQGRGERFKNKAERDAWLKKEIDELNATMTAQQANRTEAQEEVTNVQSEIATLEADIEGLRQRFEGWGGSRQALAEEVQAAKDALTHVSEERKQILRDGDKLESNISSARQELDRAERDLSHAMDGQTARGLATIRRIKREQNLTGAYGTLAELFEVNETYRVAAEVTAGHSLFHYVVDNEKTATKLADILYKEKGGRITFVPLDQLRSRPANLPNTAHAVPLINKIKYDARFEKAFQQVFGKTVVCPNLIIAGEYARSHGVNTITTDGDTQNKKGAITGGFIDTRKSRLAAVRNLEKWRDEHDSFRERLREIRAESERKEQEITHAKGELQKAEQKLRQLNDGLEPLRAELRSKTMHLDRQKDRLDASLRRLETLDSLLAQLSEQLKAFQAERAAKFEKTLTAAEEQELERLNVEVAELRKRWNELSTSRRELEGRKNLLEVDLRENLHPKLDQLNSQDIDMSVGEGLTNLKETQRELKRISKIVNDLESKLQENEQEIETSESKTANLQKERYQREQQQEEIAKAIEKHDKIMNKSVRRKAVLTAAAAECAKNIRDLGVLPEEAFERFENTDSAIVSVFSQ
jgi:structural maintenance of chromosome 3 (chondroitin sulfate proteoglycan 6)